MSPQVIVCIISIGFIASCTEQLDRKQIIAEDSIRAFESRRISDTVLPEPFTYSQYEMTPFTFDRSPEANFFPYLDLKYEDYYWDQSEHYLYENAWKEAEKN